MDSSIAVMGTLTIIMAIWAFMKSPELPLRGLQMGFELLQDVWLPLLLGFCLAGFFDVLISREMLIKWMGEQSGVQGILLGWPLTAARTIPSLLLPPIVGFIGQRLFVLFNRSFPSP